MKNATIVIVTVLIAAGIFGFGRYWYSHKGDPKIAKFHSDTDNLLQALQQYKEFAGSYPTGSNLEIAKAMAGKGDKKITILAVRKSEVNEKGEIIDPWGTPLQFYFAPNAILIRSAGP